jgi:hypothetical protein
MEIYERSSSSGLADVTSNSPAFCQVLVLHCQNFHSPRPEPWHDMMQVDKGELFAHHNIHFEIHMEVYERSSSSVLGGMVASDNPSFCQVLVLHCQNFDSPRPEPWHDMMQVDKGELFAHHNIHFEIHMDVYERSSSSVLADMVASNSPSFGQVLVSHLSILHDMTLLSVYTYLLFVR